MSYNAKKMLSKEEKDLLDIFRSSKLSAEDVKWIKNKRWFKRFLILYIKELKKLPIKEIEKTPVQNKIKNDNIEVLDFTQSINIENKEVIEILDFTKTVDLSDVKNISELTLKARKKIELEKNILYFIIIISFILIFILIIALFNNKTDSKENTGITKDIYEASEIKKVDLNDTSIIENADNNVEDLYTKYKNLSLLEVNLNDFKETNQEITGWVKVNGTEVNYPFVQHEDNEYYLKHSFDKSYNKKGWVFLDYRNNFEEELNKNTILYAHGLVNNQMFGSLRRIFNSNWYTNKDNYIIQTASFGSSQLWEVFSIYKIEPESYYISTYFNNDNDYQKFIDTVKGRSIYNFGVNVNVADKILTLSSCYDNEKRMVLHAKLVAYQTRN